MRQLNLARDIADGVNALRRCAHMIVHLDKAAAIRCDSDVLQAAFCRHGLSSDAYDYRARRAAFGFSVHFKFYRAPVLNALNARAQQKFYLFLFQNCLYLRSDFGNHAGQNILHHFNNGHALAQRGKQRGKFQTDYAAAHHDYIVDQIIRRQHIIAGIGIFDARNRWARGCGTHRQNRPIESYHPIAHLNAVRRGKPAEAMDHFHAVRPLQRFDAAAQARDARVFEFHQLRIIDAYIFRMNSKRAAGEHAFIDLRAVQKRLGGNAAAV